MASDGHHLTHTARCQANNHFTKVILDSMFILRYCMPMEPTQTVTVRQIPTYLWRAVRMSALAAGKSVSAFVTEALQKAVNPK